LLLSSPQVLAFSEKEGTTVSSTVPGGFTWFGNLFLPVACLFQNLLHRHFSLSQILQWILSKKGFHPLFLSSLTYQ